MGDLAIILASVTAISLIAFVGIFFLGLKERLLKRVTMALVGFASGTLLGTSFLHMLPESLNYGNDLITAFYLVVLGIVFFFAMEKFLHWRHCHIGACPVHTFVYLNVVGDGIHNFIDGMIVATTFMLSFELGLVTTLAVISHEIPQEVGDFGVLVYGGLSKTKALTYNFISAVTSIFGAIIAYLLAYAHDIGGILVPVAAGGFIYIAATDLMPELHKKPQVSESLIQLSLILLGIFLMAFLRAVLKA